MIVFLNIIFLKFIILKNSFPQNMCICFHTFLIVIIFYFEIIYIGIYIYEKYVMFENIIKINFVTHFYLFFIRAGS